MITRLHLLRASLGCSNTSNSGAAAGILLMLHFLGPWSKLRIPREKPDTQHILENVRINPCQHVFRARAEEYSVMIYGIEQDAHSRKKSKMHNLCEERQNFI